MTKVITTFAFLIYLMSNIIQNTATQPKEDVAQGKQKEKCVLNTTGTQTLMQFSIVTVGKFHMSNF